MRAQLSQVDPSTDGLLSRQLINLNMFYTYVIRNDKDKIYIGYTSDLEKRLLRHNGLLRNKVTSFTYKNKGLWVIVYQEKFNTRTEAMKREKELKSSRGRNFIRSLLIK